MGGVSEWRKGNCGFLEFPRLPIKERWGKRAKVDLEKKLAFEWEGVIFDWLHCGPARA